LAAAGKKPEVARFDELYGLAPGEFTAARNALAKRLKADGDAEAAKEVAAAKKPTTPAWAVNQLARESKERVKELLSLGAELRAAQARLVRGGDAGELLDLSDRERRLVQDLVEEAGTALERIGARASEATLDEVRETLHAAALDEESAAAVEEGRLVKERRAIGLGLGPLGTEAPATRRKPAAKKTPSPRVKRAERRLEEAREAAREAREAAEAAAGALERAEREASRAAKNAERAAERETQAAEALARAKR
jgi:hypothetical protein